MSEWSFAVGESGGKRLQTAGKYCDRDILLNLDEAIPEEVNAQNALLDQAIAALEGKAAGGIGDVGGLTQYAKVIATPESASELTIKNPLGGIARKICVRRLTDVVASTRKIQLYIADTDLGLGVMRLVATDGGARYGTYPFDSGTGNGKFRVTDGLITLYRYNAANAWDAANEYEIEIWQ